MTLAGIVLATKLCTIDYKWHHSKCLKILHEISRHSKYYEKYMFCWRYQVIMHLL